MIERTKNKVNSAELPYVFNYINVNKYLLDYYAYRKTMTSKFSFDIWSAEMNLKSRSSLRMVCQGKKIVTDVFVEKFAANEKLSNSEKEYFNLLARYQHEKSKELKNAIFARIAEKTKILGNPTEIIERMKFLSDSILPTLHMLISFADFRATETNLIQTLKITKTQLKKHLDTLESLGLIQSQTVESKKEKTWVSTCKYFKVPDQVNNEAIKIYQKETLAESSEALLQKQEEETRFRTILFSLAQADFTHLSEDIENFMSKLKFKYGNDFIKDKKIYKVNLQTYPVTD